MKFKFNCMSCILTSSPRLQLHFNERLDIAGGKGKEVLF